MPYTIDALAAAVFTPPVFIASAAVVHGAAAVVAVHSALAAAIAFAHQQEVARADDEVCPWRYDWRRRGGGGRMG